MLLQIRRVLLYLSCLFLLGIALARSGRAATWLPFGPDGGDARSLAGDPHDSKHLYLGTANGWIYESRDSGSGWTRLALVGHRDDLILDRIVVDPADSKHLVVATWALGKPDGGIYISHDGGASWSAAGDLRGQSVLSLAASASDPKIYAAGTLEGVYRSMDAGEHWALISPAGSKELHEIQSVAVDPADPQVIYAGTWHLPWKTVDGGQNWTNIKEGIIDDSDVFSIIVDPKQPKTVYASACSGIYKSDDAGEQFHKVQGIPSTARRTRVLKQDVNEREVVFAGTTEGLFRTQNAGSDWSRMTDPNVIVNDVYVDPADSKHVLLATDRAGILASSDGGVSFEPANKGFSSRQVTSYAADAQRPGTMYVGVINDKNFGGVFESETGGLSWFQRNTGLDGRDIFSLIQAPDGALVAGTAHGIFRLEADQWSRAQVTPSSGAAGKTAPTRAAANPKAGAHATDVTTSSRKSSHKPVPRTRTGPKLEVVRGRAAPTKPGQLPVGQQRVSPAASAATFDGGTFALARSGDTLYAATTAGVFMSDTSGKNWNPVPGVEVKEWRIASAAKGIIAVADLKTLVRSVDGGASWQSVALPSQLTQINAMSTNDAGETWVGGIEGIFFQSSGQAEWQALKGFYIRDVNSIYFDPQNQRMLVTSNAPGHIVLGIHVPDHATSYWDAGWHMRFVRPVGDYLVGATLFDGVVVQPRMVESTSAQSTH